MKIGTQPARTLVLELQCPDDSTLAVSLCSKVLSHYLTLSTGLPPDTRSEDVSKFFDGYGRIVDVRVMTGM